MEQTSVNAAGNEQDSMLWALTWWLYGIPGHASNPMWVWPGRAEIMHTRQAWLNPSFIGNDCQIEPWEP